MADFRKYLNERAMGYEDLIEDLAFDLHNMRYDGKTSKGFGNKVRDMAYAVAKVYNKDPMQVERYLYSHMNSMK